MPRARVDHPGGTGIGRSRHVEQATRGGYGGDDLLFTYANQLILGKAILRARFLETEPLLIAVWDGARRGKPGGTAECVSAWDENGFPSVIIHPATAAVTERPGTGRRKRGARRKRRSTPLRSGESAVRQTMAILFADMVGYSRLREEQIPGYAQGFLAALAETLARTGHTPEYKNTWGDALCFVFDDPLAAADCAIAMRDTVRTTNWEQRGLPKDISMRIGLHAGPVFRVREPLVDRQNFFGFHMNQAARIEPITRPGNVYASEAFASLLLADRRNTFDCRYVGVIVFPRNLEATRSTISRERRKWDNGMARKRISRKKTSRRKVKRSTRKTAKRSVKRKAAKRKARRPAKKTARRKTAKRRVRRPASKTAKRKVARRKPAKRKTAKRKAPKRRTARRKTAKRKAPQTQDCQTPGREAKEDRR